MNGFIISVIILVACAGATAFAVHRLGRIVQSSRASYLCPEAYRLAYRAIGRLHDADDDRYLNAQQGPGERLRQRLRSERQLALGLYLDQIREDFGHACGQARELAARSEDPNAASAILRQELRFRTLYFAVRAQNLLGWSKVGSAAKLLDLIDSMTAAGEEAGATSSVA